jgi:hypothetical protein
MRGMLVLLFAALSLAPQQPPRDSRVQAPGSGTAEIRGRVLAADTGLPLAGAIVSLSAVTIAQIVIREGIIPPPSSVETAADGSYVFSGLRAGEYRLVARDAPTRDRYVRGSYGSNGPEGGAPIRIADGQRVRGIDIQLEPAGVIAGQVTGEDGDALARVTVTAFRWTGSRPARIGVPAYTDDRGHYRLFGLTPGPYLVAAEYRTVSANGSHGLRVTYSPAAFAPSDARLLQVSGGRVTQADIRMTRARLIQVSGLLLNARGEPVPGGSVTLVPQHGLDTRGTSAQTSDQGLFAFRGLLPGDYRLVGRAYFTGVLPAGGGRELTAMDLNAGDDIEHLVVMTRPGATVTAGIRFETPPPDGARATISVVSAEPCEGLLSGRSPATITGLGDTVFPDLFGRVVFRLSGMAPQWIAKVRHGGRDITDVPTLFAPRDSVEIVLTDRSATLSGIVRGGVFGDRVLLFADDPDAWVPHSSRVRTAFIQDDGRFTLRGMHAGSYYVVALRSRDAAEVGEMGAPLLGALTVMSTRVALAEGETREVEVRFAETRR